MPCINLKLSILLLVTRKTAILGKNDSEIYGIYTITTPFPIDMHKGDVTLLNERPNIVFKNHS